MGEIGEWGKLMRMFEILLWEMVMCVCTRVRIHTAVH